MNIEELFRNNALCARFGIKYLDDKLEGILKGDLILLGARSGAGKSTIAELIATYNGQNGVKVTLISLENFAGDNKLTKMYYKYKELTQQYYLTLRQFACGNFNIDKSALQKAENYADSIFENVHIINRQNGYTIENLCDDIIGAVCKEDSKLVIIDHIDYLDKTVSSQSELEHITKVIRTIREAQYTFKVPVVAISHLRKPAFCKEEIKIPGMDEFIGSSNKVKEATCVIMLAPDDETNTTQLGTLKSTWCCIRKLRMGGVDNTAAKIYFDTVTGRYKDDYTLYRVNYAGTKVEEIRHNKYGYGRFEYE